MKTLFSDLVLTAEELGWDVAFFGDEAEFQKCSGMGEDFSFSAQAGGLAALARDVFLYAEEFDAEDHAVMWYGAGRGEPPSIQILLEDVDGIQRDLDELADALIACAKEGARAREGKR